MGNSSTKESRPPSSLSHSRPGSLRNASSPTATGPSDGSSRAGGDRLTASLYGTSRSGRGSRPDISILGFGGSTDRDALPAEMTRRETKAEREARKLEKERIARAKERDRSMREESVDGGYLVTLGTYTGPEDFNKQVVRQLMIERKLAPFWKGLNDHSSTWTEHQLVAAVQGLPIPAADEPPPEDSGRPTSTSESNPRSSDSNINNLTVPIVGRSPSSNSDKSGHLSPGHAPAFSLPAQSPIGSTHSSSPFFRGRAKTLAALTTSRNNSQTDMTPQEVNLPKDACVNGQRIEGFLYKDADECPICFLYYPPHLNRTRCCDQPICSECFVQIKRPDPHPPEHHDPNDPDAAHEQPEDNMLVSEPAACPYCVQPEFGVTYEPPPFRRGLVYSNQAHPLAKASSAMSSSSSLASQGLGPSNAGPRKRATSLSAGSPSVITTDRVRPDWAKKLADARAHALRRAAAATALHNAAYVLGTQGSSDGRGFGLGRRRRTMFGGDSPNGSGHGTPRHDRHGSGGRGAEGQGDIFPGRHGPRRTRMEDLEELMMMEAIRLSLAAEEERKKKEDKEAAKEAKKEEKKKAKEAKKAEKAARKGGFLSVVHPDAEAGPSTAPNIKGKGVDRSKGAGPDESGEPSSPSNAFSAADDPQRYLEQSRSQIHGQPAEQGESGPPPFSSPLGAGTDPFAHRQMLRQLSHDSSSASSVVESAPGSLRNSIAVYEPSPNTSGLSLSSSIHDSRGTDTPSGASIGAEPMFNFRSLAAVIGNEDKLDPQREPAEDASIFSETPPSAPAELGAASGDANARRALGPPGLVTPPEEGDSSMEKSVATVKPARPGGDSAADEDDIAIFPSPSPSPSAQIRGNPLDQKHPDGIRMMDHGSLPQQATQ